MTQSYKAIDVRDLIADTINRMNLDQTAKIRVIQAFREAMPTQDWTTLASGKLPVPARYTGWG